MCGAILGWLEVMAAAANAEALAPTAVQSFHHGTDSRGQHVTDLAAGGFGHGPQGVVGQALPPRFGQQQGDVTVVKLFGKQSCADQPPQLACGEGTRQAGVDLQRRRRAGERVGEREVAQRVPVLRRQRALPAGIRTAEQGRDRAPNPQGLARKSRMIFALSASLAFFGTSPETSFFTSPRASSL